MFKQANNDIRSAKAGIPNWIIASKLSISEGSFIRWMRTEMSHTKKAKVLVAIEEIKEEMKGEK